MMKVKLWRNAWWLLFALFLSWGYSPGLGDAADNPKTFTDQQGYFSFTPPPGWTERDYPGQTVGHIRFTSPDKEATLSIIVMPATPEEAIFEKLLAAKRRIVEKMRREKPDGKYGLAEATI